MRGGTKSRGYTIIEVMIFLAISGLMFVMAAIFVSGKQATAEFSQGMNDVNTKVQQVISDVGNGFYPSGQNFKCVAGSSGPPTIIGSSGGPEQGANIDCTFVGKILQFNLSSSSYEIYSLAGRQCTGSSANCVDAGNLTTADPVPIRSASGNADTTENNNLKWGLTVTKMEDKNSTSSIAAIAFISSFPSQNPGPSGGLLSGSQTVQVYSINDASGFPGGVNAALLNSSITKLLTNPNILICFSGGNGKYGSLVIGGSSANGLSTDMHIYTDKVSWQSPSVGC